MRLARGRWRSAPSLPFEPSDDAVIFGCGRDLLLLRARHGDRSIVRRGRDRPTRRPVPAHPLGLGEPSLGGRAMPRLPCPTRWLSPSRVRRRALSPLRRATHFLRLSRRGAGQLTARSWHALGCPREHSGTRAVSQLGWLYGMVLAVDPEANKVWSSASTTRFGQGATSSSRPRCSRMTTCDTIFDLRQPCQGRADRRRSCERFVRRSPTCVGESIFSLRSEISWLRGGRHPALTRDLGRASRRQGAPPSSRG